MSRRNGCLINIHKAAMAAEDGCDTVERRCLRGAGFARLTGEVAEERSEAT